jgi:DNA-binding NtrC family response regulator
MNRAQILVFGGEGRLADQLQELGQARSLWVRDVRHGKTCLNLLRQGGPGLLVLKFGKNLEQELSLLAQVKLLFPEIAVLVVGDTEHPTLAGLCWDLGAAYVLFPPEPVERLREVIAGFLP